MRAGIYREMEDHFSHLPNLREAMARTGWSTYLYDYFDISANDPCEEAYYNTMCKCIEERWFYTSEGDRLNWMRNASEEDREAMVDNARDFDQTCGAVARL
jgi:hypothetical protein